MKTQREKEFEINEIQKKIVPLQLKINAYKAELASLDEQQDKELPDGETIEDGFGSEWSLRCPECGKDSMQVVRPGKAQCKYCG